MKHVGRSRDGVRPSLATVRQEELKKTSPREVYEYGASVRVASKVARIMVEALLSFHLFCLYQCILVCLRLLMIVYEHARHHLCL